MHHGGRAAHRARARGLALEQRALTKVLARLYDVVELLGAVRRLADDVQLTAEQAVEVRHLVRVRV